MYIQIGYKFILGFLAVVAAVAFVPQWVDKLGYPPEVTHVLSYVVALTLGLILGSFFSKSFTRNISRLKASAEAISDGDLTGSAELPPTRFPDETRDLAVSINRMMESLQVLVQQIRGTSEKVSLSSRGLSTSAQEVNVSSIEVAQAVEQISRGAETQSEMVTRCSKVIHEMAVSVDIIARRAKETATAARETSQTAQRGGEIANDSLERMKSFFDGVGLIGKEFAQLNAKLQQVGKMADFIVEMARQTNLLALNASIEAARAGDYGKGFAVVAEEVRKLADNSSKSATEIVETIDIVKQGSQRLQETIAESSRSIAGGKRNIDTTIESFNKIVATVVETERKANSIADLSVMQNTGAEKMVSMVDEIARVAEDNAAATEQVSAATEEQSMAMQEMAQAAQELTQLAGELLRSVERFRLSDEPPVEATDVVPPPESEPGV
ncbi:methyl-accepting chemotaxis protein [Geomesophilobacter sediminis]|uniref:Methyl-accepting chemotaxis protein n=1 Tax=Geomesophilobacter sediminis TaxID=2798584 RepID=A0A8J7SB70_9BACT|nr:methyl-accepting chemotaxis protein [Geomesophilobacter sediminis]MBJ6727900.1 methyl-accepting chemotaxis protein [Geomesophilobacter sediminis]